MKRPWLKFYPSDWRDPALRMCSLAARGLWIDLISFMHAGEPYGHLTLYGVRIGDDEIAALVGRPIPEVRRALAELDARRVLSRTDAGIIFSRRMVRDKAKSDADEANGKGGGNPDLLKGVNPPDKGPDKAQKLEARNQIPERETSERQRKRGSRLPLEWAPSIDDLAYAKARGLNENQSQTEALKFRNYWTAKAGAGGIKLDWSRTWQNWILNSHPQNGAQNGHHAANPSGKNVSDVMRELLAECSDDAREYPDRMLPEG